MPPFKYIYKVYIKQLRQLEQKKKTRGGTNI